MLSSDLKGGGCDNYRRGAVSCGGSNFPPPMMIPSFGGGQTHSFSVAMKTGDKDKERSIQCTYQEERLSLRKRGFWSKRFSELDATLDRFSANPRNCGRMQIVVRSRSHNFESVVKCTIYEKEMQFRTGEKEGGKDNSRILRRRTTVIFSHLELYVFGRQKLLQLT